ncbi:MAG: MFS transporter [Anaerolineales bacterium]
MFSVLRNRSFFHIWLAQLISSMGSALTILAASVLVYRETGSALSVGLMLIATSGPTVLIGLFAGVFVDRYDRKRIMLGADLLRAVLIFLIPFLIPLNLYWLYVIVAVTSGFTQFFDSAHASVLPEVASDEELSAANALMSISSVGSQMIGFAAAGLIVSNLPVEWAFYLDAASFMISALLIWLTRLPAMPMIETTSLRAIGENLIAGVRVVGNLPILRSLFLVAAPVFLIFGLNNTLLLPFALRALQATEFHFGLQQASEAVGIAVGSLIMARLADRIREGQWLAISYMLMALGSIWYSFARNIALGILLIGLIGVVNAPSFIGRQLVIQRATPREMRGRVNSAFFVVRDVMFVLGMALAGLADVFDVRLLFRINAYGMLLVGLVVLVLPGLGQPAAQWKRTISLLRGVEAAPRLGTGRPASLVEIERLTSHLPELMRMSLKERTKLASDTLVAEAPGGTLVTYRGEVSDAAYFILKGSVGVGYLNDQEYLVVNYLREGDFFGEIAALMGTVRSANVIAEEDSEFLILPSRVMQRLAKEYEGLRQLFYRTMAERLNKIELPFGTSLDQDLLRELRTSQPDRKEEPILA